MYNLLYHKGHGIQVPINDKLKRVYMYFRTTNYILLAPDTVITRPTKSLYKNNFIITEKSETALKIRCETNLNKQLPRDYIVVIQPDAARGQYSLSEVLSGPDTVIDVITPEMVDSIIPSDKELFKLFDVGRVNGPADSRLVGKEEIDGVKFGYDSNSRIRIKCDGYTIQFTYKVDRLRNMAQIDKPNGTKAIIMGYQFDLFTLGLYILSNNYQMAVPLVKDLINKFK